MSSSNPQSAIRNPQSAIGNRQSETLYVPLADGLSAKVTIEIREEPMPTPHEQPHKRRPTVRELHDTAEKLLRRIYQFHPIDE